MKKLLASCMLFVAAFASPAAQAQATQAITIQLNTAKTEGTACRLTFVIRNEQETPLEALGLDLVLFDKSEGVSGYAAVDFGAMPAGKTIVRQYDVGNGACTDISRVLLNEIRSCEIGGGAKADCLARLKISSRSEIDFIL